MAEKRTSVSTGSGSLVILVAAVVICSLISCEKQSSVPPSTPPVTSREPAPKPSLALPPYTVVSVQDLSYGGGARKSYRISVQRTVTKDELTGIANAIVVEATGKDQLDEIIMYFYLPDSDINGAYTAGHAIWAPGGDRDGAAGSAPHQLVVEAGSALGTVDEKNVVDLPVGKKKEIFREIVSAEDRAYADAKRAHPVDLGKQLALKNKFVGKYKADVARRHRLTG